MGNKRKNLLLINPISGTASKRRLHELLASRLDDNKDILFTAITQYGGHAKELVNEAQSMGFDTIIAAGGDGTINEIASAMKNSRMTLGIVPMGSGNGLARSLNIPLNNEQAVSIIANRHAQAIDCGVANGQTFFCTFGMGFDAEVTHSYEQKSFRGALSYIISTVDSFFTTEPARYRIRSNGELFVREAHLVTCANIEQYGNNAYIAPNASPNDGLLDLVIVGKVPRYKAPRLALELFTKELKEGHEINILRSDSFTIERDNEGYVQIDGESARMGRLINITVQKHALEVYCPEKTDT